MSTCLDVIYVTMKRNNRVCLSRLSIIPRGRRLVGTRTPSWRRAKNSGLIKGEVHFSEGIALRIFLVLYICLFFVVSFFFFFTGYDIWMISSDKLNRKSRIFFTAEKKVLDFKAS